MDVTILTLRYSATRKGIDDAPLREALVGRSLLSFREHLFEVHGAPHVACVLVTEARSENRDQKARAEETDHDRLPPTPRSGPDPGRRRSGAQSPAAQELDPEKRPVFEKLRRWRITRARDEGVPPYVILTNRQLLDILRVWPTSAGALARVDGIGKAKIERALGGLPHGARKHAGAEGAPLRAVALLALAAPLRANTTIGGGSLPPATA